MNYTVVWDQSAQDDLTQIWLAAVNRQAITDAANDIDQTLRRDPYQFSTDFYGDRLLVVDPLSVVFSVNDDDRIVRVLHVW